MNLGEIKTNVRRTFGDESSVQVTDADIVRWANLGQREVVLQNPELLEAIATANSVANQQDYTYPANMRLLRSVMYKASTSLSYQKLEGRSLQEFDEYIDGWDGTAFGPGAPRIYCTFANVIKLFPIPDESITNGLKLYYYRQPTDLALDADVIDLPLGYHNAVVQFCLKQAYELDEDWTSVGNKVQEFNSTVAGQKGQEKDNARATYPRITVLAEDDDWGYEGVL